MSESKESVPYVQTCAICERPTSNGDHFCAEHMPRCTCYKCGAKDVCEWAWDWYNSDGDCLGDK
jgi:hypothetical protein